MSENVFGFINPNISEEAIDKIAKTGVIPPEAKDVETKLYWVIFQLNFKYGSYIEENLEIDGEAIIVTGRHNCLIKILEYLEADAGLDVNIDTSVMTTEGFDIGKAPSVRRFLIASIKHYPKDSERINEILNLYSDKIHDDNSTTMATGNGSSGTFLKED